MAVEPYGSVTSSPYTNNYTNVSESLTSGSRINQSADDAAGLAVATTMTSQINEQDMASRNANDGISLLQTADSASESINNNLLRMQELSLQSLNGTLSSSQRQMLNEEFQQNLQSLNETANNAQFNGIELLNANNDSVNIALGESNNTLNLPDLTSDGLGLSGLDITNPANATLALEGLTQASEQLLNNRSQFGAQQNSLSSAVENLNNQNLNVLSSRSQISDTDYGRAATEQARQDILQESSVAMLAQKNQSRDNVLQLLGG